MLDYPEKIDSKFRYVLLASQRAEQLMRGAISKLDKAPPKPTTAAMEEIRTDAVEWDYGPAEPAPAVDEEAAEGEEETEAEAEAS